MRQAAILNHPLSKMIEQLSCFCFFILRNARRDGTGLTKVVAEKLFGGSRGIGVLALGGTAATTRKMAPES